MPPTTCETWLAKHERSHAAVPRAQPGCGSQTDGRGGAADIERRAEFYDRELTRAEPDAQALPLSVAGTGDYILEHLQESTDFRCWRSPRHHGAAMPT